MKYLCLILMISFNLSATYDARKIGERIWHNECGGNPDLLIWWHPREAFPSLGIGHFIWYPISYQGPYIQIFPIFLEYCKKHKVRMPKWLAQAHFAPWLNRAEFLADMQSKRMAELNKFLRQNLKIQARFLIDRLESILPQIYAALPWDSRYIITQYVDVLSETTQGYYVLVDYLNFKGDGLSKCERYRGYGWGLLQVLEEMKPKSYTERDLLNAFADAARLILERRVRNAPEERHEEQFLPGWLNRIKTYRI